MCWPIAWRQSWPNLANGAERLHRHARESAAFRADAWHFVDQLLIWINAPKATTAMPHALVRICGFPMIRLPSIIAALAEPTRLSATRLLWNGEEHCVCELMEFLGATQSRMSRHMSVLKAAGLVLDRRDAQWVRYRRNPKLDPAVTRMVAAIVRAADALDVPLGARDAA